MGTVSSDQYRTGGESVYKCLYVHGKCTLAGYLGRARPRLNQPPPLVPVPQMVRSVF